MERLAKKLVLALVSLVVFSFPAWGEENAESIARTKSMEVVTSFITRNSLAMSNFGSNDLASYHAEFFTGGRPGYLARVKLKTGFGFTVHSDGTNATIDWFNDGVTKTYYALEDAPKEKVAAVKSLISRNKLSTTNTLAVAEKFFSLQGHKAENFHAPVLHQSYWAGGENGRGGDLPYYEITWYRKDVKQEDIESGTSMLPSVIIEISGIDSHLISYTRAFMPVGEDF